MSSRMLSQKINSGPNAVSWRERGACVPTHRVTVISATTPHQISIVHVQHKQLIGGNIICWGWTKRSKNKHCYCIIKRNNCVIYAGSKHKTPLYIETYLCKIGLKSDHFKCITRKNWSTETKFKYITCKIYGMCQTKIVYNICPCRIE